MNYIKIVFWFVLFFIAFFLKAYTVGGQELVYLWKLPLLLFLFIGVLGQPVKYLFLFIAYAFAVKNIVNVSFFNYPLDAIVNFLKYLTIPLLAHWLVLNVNTAESLKRLREVLLYVSIFIILANVPYYLGIIASVKSKTMLWMEDSKLDAMVGILGAPHYTSAVLAVASIVIIEFIVKKRTDSLLNFILIPILILGLFFLFKTYARTGWLMFLIGIIVLLVRNLSVRNLGKMTIIGVLLIGGLTLLFQNNEGFRRRIMDERAGQDNEATYETVGSGRLQIAQIYLENLYESNFSTYLLGMGLEESQNRYEKKAGSPLFAHNAFVQTLVDNGILGLILYLVFLITLCKQILLSRSSHNDLTLAVFLMFLSCLATQQANYFLVDILFAICIAISLKESSINKFVAHRKLALSTQ